MRVFEACLRGSTPWSAAKFVRVWRNGIRAEFKPPCPEGYAGSIPVTRTNISFTRVWCNSSHASLRNWCPEGRAGAIPVTRTKEDAGVGSPIGLENRGSRKANRSMRIIFRQIWILLGLAP